LRTSIENTTEILTKFFNTGELSASEKFSTYVQTQAGAEWSSVKTQRTAWTTKLAERLQDEVDQQEEE